MIYTPAKITHCMVSFLYFHKNLKPHKSGGCQKASTTGKLEILNHKINENKYRNEMYKPRVNIFLPSEIVQKGTECKESLNEKETSYNI